MTKSADEIAMDVLDRLAKLDAERNDLLTLWASLKPKGVNKDGSRRRRRAGKVDRKVRDADESRSA